MALDTLNSGDTGATARGKINAGFSAIDGEANRAAQAEASLASDLTTERRVRGDADTALGARIDGEAVARESGDTAVGGRVDGEISERRDADTALGARIDGETSQRRDGDAALGGRIDGEATARTDGDAALGGRIDGEISERRDGDAALGTRIDGEASERRDGVAILNDRIDGEATARQGGDTALGDRIDGAVTALGARIDGAVTALGARIDGEATARQGGDTALGDRIDGAVTALGARIDGEATARQGGDTALGDRIDVLGQRITAVRVLATLASRPGDSPDLFCSDLASGTTGLPPSAAVVATAQGKVVRVAGAAILAAVSLFAVEPNRLYKLRAVVRRQNDTLDPAGDGVMVAVAWYDTFGRCMTGAATPVAILPLAVAMGRRQFTALIALAPADPNTIAVPSGAVYGRPFAQMFGDTAVTDVEVLTVDDVTDAGTVSIDIDDIADRQSRLEAAQAAVPSTVLTEAFYDALIFG